MSGEIPMAGIETLLSAFEVRVDPLAYRQGEGREVEKEPAAEGA